MAHWWLTAIVVRRTGTLTMNELENREWIVGKSMIVLDQFFWKKFCVNVCGAHILVPAMVHRNYVYTNSLCVYPQQHHPIYFGLDYVRRTYYSAQQSTSAPYYIHSHRQTDTNNRTTVCVAHLAHVEWIFAVSYDVFHRDVAPPPSLPSYLPTCHFNCVMRTASYSLSIEWDTQ